MRRFLLAAGLFLALAGAADAQRTVGVPDMRVILASQPAATLSAYGLFSDLATRTPATGVIGYDLATPLFSDYALKSRLLFVPPKTTSRYSGDAVFDFPVGTVLIKTFAYPADLRRPEEDVRPLETRLLVRKAEGWSALAYVWDADGRDAHLQVAGAQIPVHFVDGDGATRDIAYAVPNKNQCKGCHAHDDAVTPIGPTARNLGHDGQLARWVGAGILDAAPPQGAAPTTLDARARAYLAINCAHCHNPHGPASNSGLDLRAEQTNPARWGVRKRPVAAGRAAANMLFAIDPGHPESSILLYRMESTDPGVMMPEVGRTLVHREGVELIRRWIAAMDDTGHVTESN